MSNRGTIKILGILSLSVILFYWKILLTHQFSLLTDPEGVNQAYSWLTFWIRSVHRGGVPLWDPFVMAGRSFAGEMQTAAYYPLHLLLALVPFNRNGLLSPTIYHWWFALSHLLGAVFMYALAREFRLSRFAAMIAGMSFALGGFVGRALWPHMFESAIWMPLVFLFFKRAIDAGTMRSAVLNAHWSGLMIGLAALAGGLHVVMMQALAVAAAAIFAAFNPEPPDARSGRSAWLRPGLALAIAGGTAFCASAVQIIPSFEYSKHAIRFIGDFGAVGGAQAIPYAHLTNDSLWPQAIMSFLMPYAFDGNFGSGERINPYMGAFPLLAAVIGIWKFWGNKWVRYLAILAVCAVLYSFGPFSFLHGVLYALVPKLWLAREASRFTYLANFALALLAGFGTEALLQRGIPEIEWRGLTRILSAVAAVCAAFLLIPALMSRPNISPWIFDPDHSGLLRYIPAGHTRGHGPWTAGHDCGFDPVRPWRFRLGLPEQD